MSSHRCPSPPAVRGRMPEGHTLHRLAGQLSSAFAGQVVRVSSPQGRFTDAVQVDGTVLVGATSAGKHLFLEFEHDVFVHVHLGLIGKFDVHEGAPAAPVGQVRLRLVGERAYADLRGATQCELISSERRDAILGALGPDPLRPDADPMRAWARISRSHRPIGDLLMDQTVLAGVGNVYPAPDASTATRSHPAGGAVPGPVGRPRGADGDRRANGADRHGASRAHPGGHGAAAAGGRPRRRGLRLPPGGTGVSRVRVARADRDARGPESVLVSPMSTQVPLPRRTVTRTFSRISPAQEDAR
jgi:hypothetical protein